MAKKSTGRQGQVEETRRKYLSQADVPAYGLDQALRIPQAIADNYAKSPTKPLRVAQVLGTQPTSSGFRMLCGASIAYGLASGTRRWVARFVAISERHRASVEREPSCRTPRTLASAEHRDGSQSASSAAARPWGDRSNTLLHAILPTFASFRELRLFTYEANPEKYEGNLAIRWWYGSFRPKEWKKSNATAYASPIDGGTCMAARIALADLRETIYVRRVQNDAHVAHLKALYEEGANLPPIEVTRDSKTLVEGRHRVAAARALGWTELPVRWAPELPPAELTARALEANVGGPLPPTNEDITFTIGRLLDNGVKETSLTTLFGRMLPPSLVKKYIRWHHANRKRLALNKAVAAVVDDGLTAPQAAHKHSVAMADLKKKLGGKRDEPVGVKELSANIEHRLRAASMGISHDMRKMMDLLDDGLFTPDEARKVLAGVERGIKSMLSTNHGWANRVEGRVRSLNVAGLKAVE